MGKIDARINEIVSKVKIGVKLTVEEHKYMDEYDKELQKIYLKVWDNEKLTEEEDKYYKKNGSLEEMFTCAYYSYNTYAD